MSKGLIAVLATLGVVFFVVAVLVGSYISNANYGNATEQLIKATYENNQNVLAQYGQKVAEVAQVPGMYRDDLQKVTTAAIQGRYGEAGSKAVFQFIKEQNPSIDASMYKQIQQVIESGRNDFQNAQTTLIDQERQYNTQLGNVVSGSWLHLAGYPKIDLSKFQPITTDRASDAFHNGKESGPIQLR